MGYRILSGVRESLRAAHAEFCRGLPGKMLPIGSSEKRRGAGLKNLPFERDPVIEAYKKDVDRSLIRENLNRSVEERFLNLMALQRFALELRRAGREAEGRP